MNITEVKSELGYSVLNLNFAEDKDGNKTEWLRHWDNENRIAVSIHQDTVKEIRENNPSTLSLQSEVRTGAQGDYEAKRIVLHKPAEMTL